MEEWKGNGKKVRDVIYEYGMNSPNEIRVELSRAMSTDRL